MTKATVLRFLVSVAAAGVIWAAAPDAKAQPQAPTPGGGVAAEKCKNLEDCRALVDKLQAQVDAYSDLEKRLTELNIASNKLTQAEFAELLKQSNLSPPAQGVAMNEKLLDYFIKALKDRDDAIIALAKDRKPSALRKLVEMIPSVAAIIAIAIAK